MYCCIPPALTESSQTATESLRCGAPGAGGRQRGGPSTGEDGAHGHPRPTETAATTTATAAAAPRYGMAWPLPMRSHMMFHSVTLSGNMCDMCDI